MRPFRSVYRSICTLALVTTTALCTAAGAAEISPAEQAKHPAYVAIWTHLAVAQVGIRTPPAPDAGRPLLRRISLGVVMPGLPSPAATSQRQCVNRAFSGKPSLGEFLRNKLDKVHTSSPTFEAQQPQYDEDAEYAEGRLETFLDRRQAASAKSINETNLALEETVIEFKDRLNSPGCTGFVDTSVLILIHRVCPTAPSACETGGRSPFLPGNRYANRFDLLAQWGYAYRPPSTQGQDRSGLLLPDEPVAIYVKDLSDAGKQILGDYAKGTARLASTNVDPREPEEAAPDRQRALEELVTRLRAQRATAPATKPQLGSSIFLATGTPLEIAVRLSDPGLVTQADVALAFLRSEPKAKLLQITVDELAVTRLRECTRLRAVPISDVAKVGECAGYDFQAKEEIMKCLDGKGCVPPFKFLAPIEDAGRQVGAIPQTAAQFGYAIRDVRKLADASTLPRISSSTFTFDNLVTGARGKCANEMTENGTPSTVLSECLVKNAFPDKHFAEAYDCLRSPSLTPEQAVKCVDKGNKVDTRVLKCVKLSGKDLQNCLIESQLNSNDKGTFACVTNSVGEFQRLDCVLRQRAGVNADALKKCAATKSIDCLNALAPDLKAASIAKECPSVETPQAALNCARALGINVPAQVTQVIGCASGGSWQATAGCMAREKVGGTAGVIADCYVQSGGDALGTTGCYAGRQLGMNQDFQMAMQCAMSTGGEPLATATCTFGRLTLRELTYCKNAGFGEGKCFGKNNTLVKTLGIEKGSAVAKYINVHLDVLRGTIAFVQDPKAAAEATVRNFGRELSKAANNIQRELGNGIEQARKFAQDIVSGRGVYTRVDHRGIIVGPAKIRWR